MGETELQGAAREVKEEAGLTGHVKELLGEKKYYNESSKRTTLWKIYVMHVVEELEDWPEKKYRERKWFTIEEAYKVSGGHIDEWIHLLEKYIS